MYSTLLIIHSLFRWLVVISLVTSITVAARGYLKRTEFTSGINALRHWTATICHIQLLVGILLYTQSPHIKIYFSNNGLNEGEQLFFAIVHLILMLIGIIIITIGSAKAKRETASGSKYKTTLWWFGAGLLIILIAVPWPFSPLAHRPYIRF